MSFASQVASDLDVFYNTDEHAETITYDGSDIPAIVTYGENLGDSKRSGGRLVSKVAKATIRVKVSDVASPTYRTAVVISSVTWRVKYTISGNGDEWVIELERDERPNLYG